MNRRKTKREEGPVSSPLKLDYAVHTLDGQLLLPAGAELTVETLGEVTADNKVTSEQLHPLLDHGNVRLDLREFMNCHQYEVIFAAHDRTAAVLDLLEQARLHPVILESLDHFREHDFYTYRHIMIVYTLSTLLAHDLLPDHQEVLKGVMAGPTHDFGKICVPLEVLKKVDPLARTELLMLEHHALAGFVLLSYYFGDTQDDAARVARDHHERNDGSGYPTGTPLKDRMVEIVAAVDIYDALISLRPYRPTAYDNRTALEELAEQAGQGRISSEAVQVLVACNRKTKPHPRDCTVSSEKRGIPPADNRYGLIADEGTI